ncbi:MAG TPA: pilin [Candidatus Saccharimonadales bacterium]
MKSIFIKFLILVALASVSVLPNSVYASSSASQSEVCQGVSELNNNSGCASSASSELSINSIFRLVLNLLSAVVGITAVIMIIVGGVKYITSSGNAERTNGAKNTILYAIIGLLIVALAQIIVKFVLNKASGL